VAKLGDVYVRRRALPPQVKHEKQCSVDLPSMMESGRTKILLMSVGMIVGVLGGCTAGCWLNLSVVL
jgi:hypothetical protein